MQRTTSPRKYKITPLACLMSALLSILLLVACGGGEDSHTRPFKTLPVGNGYPTTLSFSPDGKTLAVGAQIFVEGANKWSSEVQLWSAGSWSSIATLKLGEGVMDGGVGVAFSPDGTLLAAAEPAGKVHVWRASDWHMVEEFNIERGLTALVAFSPDGKTLASTARGNKVWFWKVANWTPLPTLTISDDGANAMQFSPSSRLLATGGDDEEVHIWRLSDGAQQQRLRGHTKGITALAFSPDGAMLTSGSYDDTLRLWRISDGKSLSTWDVTPSDLIFTSRGESIIEGDLWTDPKILKVSDGSALTTFAGDRDWDAMSPKGVCLALTSDGKILAGGTNHEAIWLWNMP